MPKVRISLANKCQLLFGAAVVLILSTALAVIWHGMTEQVRKSEADHARKYVEDWLSGRIELSPTGKSIDEVPLASGEFDSDSLLLIAKEELEVAASKDRFLAHAVEQFQTHNNQQEIFEPSEDARGRPFFRYARAIRKSDLARLSGADGTGARLSASGPPGLADPLEMVLYRQFESQAAARQLQRNRFYIVFAGLLAGLLAIGVFWFITTFLILSPLRVLRATAEKVADGDLNIRADINTGDEFEQLSDIFNHMLENLKNSQEQLRSINKSLDLKLGELAESNVSLYEANKIKGEFLANVSHELRTPLNSIIGFAEVLEETLKELTGPVDEKRKRYAANIIASSRRLLDLINDLLDLAKIEAGRVELHVATISIQDTAEGLINLIRPQAEKRNIDLRMKVAPHIPPIVTDASKFQQILFNFLSNAIKFTPPEGVVTLTAGLLGAEGAPPAGGPQRGPGSAAAPLARPGALEAPAPAAAPTGAADGTNTPVTPAPLPAAATTATAAPSSTEPAQRLYVSVSDTGPGIPLDQQERIFEKFTQLDSTVTKEHQGTGLGLTICRELAALLQGRVFLDSAAGRGSTFSLVIPLTLEAKTMPLMPDLAGPSPVRSAPPVARAGASAALAERGQ